MHLAPASAVGTRRVAAAAPAQPTGSSCSVRPRTTPAKRRERQNQRPRRACTVASAASAAVSHSSAAVPRCGRSAVDGNVLDGRRGRLPVRRWLPRAALCLWLCLCCVRDGAACSVCCLGVGVTERSGARPGPRSESRGGRRAALGQPPCRGRQTCRRPQRPHRRATDRHRHRQSEGPALSRRWRRPSLGRHVRHVRHVGSRAGR
jgi:hypothetical protein